MAAEIVPQHERLANTSQCAIPVAAGRQSRSGGAQLPLLWAESMTERVQIFLGGLPYHFDEGQCRQLLEPFGELQSFELVRDREKGESKGYGFAVFADKAVTESAIVGLNGLSIDGRVLTCRKCAPRHFVLSAAVCHEPCHV